MKFVLNYNLKMFQEYNKINFLQLKGINQNKGITLNRSPSVGYSKTFIRRPINNSLDKISNKSFDFATIKKQIEERKSSYKKTNNFLKTENNNSFYDNNNIRNKSPTYYGTQLKERLLQDLKNNFYIDNNKRKKMLYLNVNVNLNQNYSLLNNNNHLNNNNNSKNLFHTPENYKHSNIFQNKSLFNEKLPTKLYTNINKIIDKKNDLYQNPLSNLNTNINNSNYIENSLINSQQNTQSTKITETQNNQKLNEQYYDLQIKLERLIRENKTHSKSKNYNSIKMIFEEGIKLLNDNIQRNFLKVILVKYHELVVSYCTDNKNLKQSFEQLQNQYLNLDKNFIEVKKILNEKEKEIERFKKEIQDLKNRTNETINNSVITFCEKEENKENPFIQSKISLNQSKNLSNQIKNNNKNILVTSKSFDSFFHNKHQNFVNTVNKNNIDDLNALYFNDKVDEKQTENSINNMKKVPQLKFDFLK